MLRPIDEWYNQKEEPLKSCLQFLRGHILQQDKAITEAWKYGMPFFVLRGKCFAISGTQKIQTALYGNRGRKEN